MASLKSLSDSELREARRAGFRRKRPKKGRLKTLNAAEGYVDRWNRYVDDAKAKVRDAKNKDAGKKRLKTLKDQIRKHR